MCGEKQFLLSSLVFVEGSPPHVRGKELRTAFKPCRLGITPACAGKSQCACTRARSARDHPRMCGEKQSNSRIRMIQKGSPPHVRGKAAHDQIRVLVLGITPACAGKRTWPTWMPPAARDHPRMCGEKLLDASNCAWFWGSPPHVRGKVVKRNFPNFPARITPACAGKSTIW